MFLLFEECRNVRSPAGQFLGPCFEVSDTDTETYLHSLSRATRDVDSPNAPVLQTSKIGTTPLAEGRGREVIRDLFSLAYLLYDLYQLQALAR